MDDEHGFTELIRSPGKNRLDAEGIQKRREYLRHNYLKRVEHQRRVADRNAEHTWRDKFARVWAT